MAAYLITGYPATGKSTLADELTKRGFTAYDTDNMPGIAHHAHKDGRPLIFDEHNKPDDFSQYDWNWDKAKLHALIDSDTNVFICAVTSNQHEFYDQFDKLFVLDLDEATMKHRLLTRTTNDYGKHPNELKDLLDSREWFVREMKKHGATIIDASQPVSKVADDILKHIS